MTETTGSTQEAMDATGEDQASVPHLAPDSGPENGAPELDPNRTYSHDDMRQVREEAKKYRHRLRETEQRVTGLQERVDRHDRAAVERMAGERLNAPDDIWLVHDVADFRGDDGGLDEAKVAAALEEIASTRTHWLKPAPNYDGGPRKPVKQPETFGAVLKRTVTGQG